jgi:hypothetical protein
MELLQTRGDFGPSSYSCKLFFDKISDLGESKFLGDEDFHCAVFAIFCKPFRVKQKQTKGEGDAAKNMESHLSFLCDKLLHCCFEFIQALGQ